WENQDIDRIVTAFQHSKDIAQGRAFGRSHDSDPTRECGDGPLAFGLEEPFFFQLLLELFESKLQRAESCGLQHLDDQLVLPPILICTDSSTGAKKLSVFRTKSKEPRIISKTYRRKLC